MQWCDIKANHKFSYRYEHTSSWKWRIYIFTCLPTTHHSRQVNKPIEFLTNRIAASPRLARLGSSSLSAIGSTWYQLSTWSQFIRGINRDFNRFFTSLAHLSFSFFPKNLPNRTKKTYNAIHSYFVWNYYIIDLIVYFSLNTCEKFRLKFVIFPFVATDLFPFKYITSHG